MIGTNEMYLSVIKTYMKIHDYYILTKKLIKELAQRVGEHLCMGRSLSLIFDIVLSFNITGVAIPALMDPRPYIKWLLRPLRILGSPLKSTN